MLSDAVLSIDRRYRYLLWRGWEVNKPYVVFIGLNPSTADKITDDPTIRRCINYAKAWGYGGLYMVNLFALRATDPLEMMAHADPVGIGNDGYIKQVCCDATMVVAAWGTNGPHLGRASDVCKMVRPLHCLTTTKNGQPGHPLYLKKDLKPVPYA